MLDETSLPRLESDPFCWVLFLRRRLPPRQPSGRTRMAANDQMLSMLTCATKSAYRVVEKQPHLKGWRSMRQLRHHPFPRINHADASVVDCQWMNSPVIYDKLNDRFSLW